jgi:cytochrome o ubiquinol oxidase operon protein cyoD
MNHHEEQQPDYGTGQKKLGVYTLGFISCVLLTLFSFWIVMAGIFPKRETFILIYAAAVIQFIVQLICFLRLNTRTEQGKTNVLTFIFTAVVLVTIIAGSLWIMWNLNYYMMH